MSCANLQTYCKSSGGPKSVQLKSRGCAGGVQRRLFVSGCVVFIQEDAPRSSMEPEPETPSRREFSSPGYNRCAKCKLVDLDIALFSSPYSCKLLAASLFCRACLLQSVRADAVFSFGRFPKFTHNFAIIQHPRFNKNSREAGMVRCLFGVGFLKPSANGS